MWKFNKFYCKWVIEQFFYKSRSWLLLYTRAGFPCSPANKKTQLLFTIDSWVDSSNLMCSIDHRWLESVIIHTASLEANKFYILYIMFCFRLMISWYRTHNNTTGANSVLIVNTTSQMLIYETAAITFISATCATTILSINWWQQHQLVLACKFNHVIKE